MPGVKRCGRADVTERIREVLADLRSGLNFSVIIHRGFTDISAFIQINPNDFLRASGRYFINNLAGGKG
jgi:hypothetical protein